MPTNLRLCALCLPFILILLQSNMRHLLKKRRERDKKLKRNQNFNDQSHFFLVHGYTWSIKSGKEITNLQAMHIYITYSMNWIGNCVLVYALFSTLDTILSICIFMNRRLEREGRGGGEVADWSKWNTKNTEKYVRLNCFSSYT